VDPARRRFLLGLALTLAAVRFLVIPWLDIQADMFERLDVLTNRLDRSTGVITNRDAILKSVAGLEAANTADRVRFPESAGTEAFRLETQQRVTSIVAARSVQLEVFDWILDREPDKAGFGQVRGRVFLKGDMRQLGLLLGDLEGGLQNMVVREAVYTFDLPVSGSGEWTASMTVVADFHFRRKLGK
jgi:hypothetical protein